MRLDTKAAVKPTSRAYEQKRNRWAMGIEEETHQGTDGVVRIATVRSYGKSKRRNIQILAKLNIRPSLEDKRFYNQNSDIKRTAPKMQNRERI